MLKVKQRFIYIFGLKKDQIIDITKKIKSFHMPDFYKGIGIKYPNEIIHLKKGKTRQ
jgi:ribosomal protein L6P/L9E